MEQEIEQRQRMSKYEFEARMQEETIASLEFKANQRLLDVMKGR